MPSPTPEEVPQKPKHPICTRSLAADPGKANYWASTPRRDEVRKLSRDVVWAEASFSLVPLGAQEHGLQHKVGRTLWQGAWSFVPLCQSWLLA